METFQDNVLRVGVVYLAVMISVLSVGFMMMAPSAPFPYFSSGSGINGYIYQIPSSMLQNTIAIDDCKDTVNALQWLKSNMSGDGVLLTHTTFYGWAMLASFNSHQLLLYEYDNPANAAINATHNGIIKYISYGG